VLKGQLVAPHEMSDQDIQWTRIVELELVPHPDQPRPEITEMDYGMRDGVLRMKLCAATAGYILRQWSVDCSPDHSLRGREYRLWLKDHLALYGVKNAALAPGYPVQGGGGKHFDNVFEFRDQLVEEYSSFSRSFTRIAAPDIRQEVERQYDAGRYWPEPLIQINPNYQRKGTVQQLVEDGILHKACADIFQAGNTEANPQPLHLYAHQMEALAKGQSGRSYVVTTGTGSGKSLSFFLPLIGRILKAKAADTTPRTR
jgi:hypothetical protein